MIIENTGKKVLMLRGYTGMSATVILLTVTLYLQVSLQHISAYFDVSSNSDQSFSFRVRSPGCPTAAWSSFSSSFSFLLVDQVWLLLQIFDFFFFNLWIKNVGLTAVYTILPLFLCLSWSNSSSSRWNIYSVIQISCIHHCLYSQLDRSVCAWDALPCLSGKHIWYGIFLTTGQ